MQLGLAPAPGVGLPAMVIPGVQPHLVTGLLSPAHQVAQVTTDRFARPGGTGQENIPAIQPCRIGAQHLPEELRFDQTPQVTAHVVRAYAEKKRRLDPRFLEHVEQPGHPFTGTPIGIDIDAQPRLHQRLPSRSNIASRRKKSRVLPMVTLSSTVGSQFSRRRALSMLGLRCETSWYPLP